MAINSSNIMVSFLRWFDSHAGVSDREFTSSKLEWIRIIPYLSLHVVSLLVFWVGFSWFALGLCFFSYFIRMFAITGFYHRYFSHRTFKTSRFMQFIFALLGCSAAQKGPLWWAAHHRHHHQYSDQPEDLHSPKQDGFWWSHVGWFLCEKNYLTDFKRIKDYEKFPELFFLNRFDTLVPIIYAVCMFFIGYFAEKFYPELGTTSWQCLIWGFFVSTVILSHCTGFINSLSHVFGSRRFQTKDTSRNNFILAIVTLGEGWHNNHHHWPSSCSQGFYWWEVDITYYMLKVLEKLGLIWDVRKVPKEVLPKA